MPRMKHEAETAGSAPVALPLGLLLLLLRFLIGVLSMRTQRRRQFPAADFRIKPPLSTKALIFERLCYPRNRLLRFRCCKFFSTVPKKENKSKETVTQDSNVSRLV